MNVVHNIALSVTEGAKNDFAEIGIDLEEGFSSFKIDESAANWTKAQQLALNYKAIDTIVTKFTTSEMNNADYLKITSSWHHGYPEPSDDFGFMRTVYSEQDNYCLECGKGRVQKEAFRLRGEPRWGAKRIMQLNWIFDEFFVTPEIWESVFRPFKVNFKDVVNHKSGNKLDTVVQLDIPIEERCLSLFGYASESCPNCSSLKYLPISSGFFPRINGNAKYPMFKTLDNFGSGNNIHKVVMVSQELYSTILEFKLKGVVFTPLENI